MGARKLEGPEAEAHAVEGFAPEVWNVRVHRWPVVEVRRGKVKGRTVHQYTRAARATTTRELGALVAPKAGLVRVYFGGVGPQWRDFYLATGAAVEAALRDWVVDVDDLKRLRNAAKEEPC